MNLKFTSLKSFVFKFKISNFFIFIRPSRNCKFFYIGELNSLVKFVNYIVDEFCDLDIIANAILLFTAGAEPISITTSLCLYELAVNKHVQDRLRDNIITAQKKSSGKITSEFLSELYYADMIMNGNAPNNKFFFDLINRIIRI